VSRFENGELRVDIRTIVADQRCLVLGSISPPDEQLLSLLLLIDTLKKERAATVTAILPYLAYARQDKDKPGQSMAAAWAGSLLEASGCDRVIAVDVHSERARRLFRVPLISLSPAQAFASAIQRLGLTQATLVAPDEGAIFRCEAVKAALGLRPSMTPYFEKHRTETGITHADLTGAVSRQAVIIDDILDTGSTLVSACEKLTQAGVDDIEIMVTHGLFTGTHWRRLWQFGVKRIFCTDTVPAAYREERIVELSIAPLLVEAMHDL
jgi:ribose-phosphate pyrophosphokinase